jgi:hypothetical protein
VIFQKKKKKEKRPNCREHSEGRRRGDGGLLTLHLVPVEFVDYSSAFGDGVACGVPADNDFVRVCAAVQVAHELVEVKVDAHVLALVVLHGERVGDLHHALGGRAQQRPDHTRLAWLAPRVVVQHRNNCKRVDSALIAPNRAAQKKRHLSFFFEGSLLLLRVRALFQKNDDVTHTKNSGQLGPTRQKKAAFCPTIG